MMSSKKVIFQSHENEEKIEVYDANDLRMLVCNDNIFQSAISLTNPDEIVFEYVKMMACSLLFLPSPKNILFLGMGAGTLPRFISQHFPKTSLDIVEISSTIIDIAYKFFFFPKDKHIKIYKEDALNYLEQIDKKYEVIFIDLYNGKGISQLKASIFDLCKERVVNEGFIAINIWKKVSEKVMEEILKEIGSKFGNNLVIFSGRENYVILVFNQDHELPSIMEIRKLASIYQEKTGLNCSEILDKMSINR